MAMRGRLFTVSPCFIESRIRRNSVQTHKTDCALKVGTRLRVQEKPSASNDAMRPLQKEKPRAGVVSFMVERVGLEPTTHGLKVRCSTD